MRAAVSVILPTLQAGADLPACLAALAEGLSAGLIRELVISDGGSTDATAAIATAAGALLITGSPGRGGQLQRAAGQASGAWFLFLHADTELQPGWADAVLHHLSTGPDHAGYFRLAFRATGLAPRIVAQGANLRSRLFGLPYGDQGLLISAALYRETGGHPDIPLMEDVVLARRLRGRLVMLRAVALTGAGRYLAHGWLRRGARNLWQLLRFLLGADPAVLAGDYSAPAVSDGDKR